MATEENNQNINRDQQNSGDNENDSSSQNNNGNIGREVDEENEGTGSFANISKDIDNEHPVNEEGVGENKEHHWSGNYGQQSSNRPSSQHNGFSDQNLTDGVQQNTSRNHVTNAGGTSQEDLEKGNSGLTDQENKS